MNTVSGKVVLRFDAGPALGGGHAIRCLGLAEALTLEGIRCVLVVTQTTLDTLPFLAGKGLEIARIRPNGSLPVPETGLADWLIVDHPDWGHTPNSNGRAAARKIAVISDAPGETLDCDILIDSAPNLSLSSYAGKVPGACRVLTGPKYALLRASFATLRRQAIARRRASTSAARIFVGFGATDPHNATAMALVALDRGASDLTADIVIGSAAPGLKDVQAQAAARNGRFQLHTDCNRVAELMGAADIAIGAAGITSWERCCLGLPTIVVGQADNQKPNCEALQAAEAAVVLGDNREAGVDQVAEALSGLLSDKDKRDRLSNNAATMCDGLGARRLTQTLFPETARDGATITMRPATAADSELLFAWQTHPDTRRYFRNPAPPTRCEHEAWIGAKLFDPDCLLNIVEYGDTPAGMLRLDALDRKGGGAEDAHEVSILVDPDRTRLGIGHAALRLGRRLLPFSHLHASVHPDNSASRHLFAGAGYIPSGDGYLQTPTLPGAVQA
jgi:UDP-2,4-diacetamido-2,4,6-trideoxy-beta-L-altropyranose hydrolase